MSADPSTASPLSAVTVVFVTYNSGAVIGRAVASVPAECPVVIVDNASPDGAAWRAGLSRSVDFLAMPANAGFGTACNAGARRAATPYVLFLNPDAVLDGETLPALLAATGRYGDPAILMPAILGENGRLMRKEGSILEKVPRRLRLSPDEIAGDYCTRFVHGAAFMMAREAFFALGGFDEAIFLYHEDDDLSLRAIARHIPIIVVTGARVTHAGGRSSAPSFGQTFRVNRAKMQSERYVLEKYGCSRPTLPQIAKLAGGCVLALACLDLHRFAIRSGKMAGCFDDVLQTPSPRV
ncbi:UNVERIFIED_ORG: GT2 family glycosyltransferase [Xanthobacter viscosus]|uniref:Glycosyltransferase family 2 protein n=1 Tax=Xanthobacter autotrophicus TaxID=280 RepID=A0A6C1KE80_XANAU|nr:glycosyltransferase family 2 protein [Xanthobacter autotrophicus]TLX42579.1 glycosyltransferase family 2 protein [Xanthobacter autotrophicus]